MTSQTTNVSIADQRDAILHGTAMIDRTDASRRIRHSGPDALDLLHRLSTNDLLSMVDGEARPTVYCSEKGRVIGVFTVVRRAADDLLLLQDSPDAAHLIESIYKYTIIEDAELHDISSDTAQFAVVGPDALRILDAADIPESQTVRQTWPKSLQRIDMIVPVSDRDTALRKLEEAGATPVSADAWHIVRVEMGIPALGSEIDERVNPLEAGLAGFINFEKGCYIGQEVVARLDTYDKLQRHLVGLRANALLPADVELQRDGRSVGRVTSAVESPEFGPIALAYVRKGHQDPGTVLDAKRIPTTVTALPFA